MVLVAGLRPSAVVVGLGVFVQVKVAQRFHGRVSAINTLPLGFGVLAPSASTCWSR